MGTVNTLNAPFYDMWLLVPWLILLLKLLPEVLKMTFSSNKKKTRKKKLGYRSLALPQTKNFGQYHSNTKFYLPNQILHALLKENASDQTQGVTRQPDLHLPHSSCEVSGKGGNGTGKEGRRPPARVPSHSSHPK